MAERELAVESGQQIEAHDGDRVDEHERQLEGQEALHHQRQDESDGESRERDAVAAEEVGGDRPGRGRLGCGFERLFGA